MARLGFSHLPRGVGGVSGHSEYMGRCRQVVEAVNAREPEMAARSDAELRVLTDSYRLRLAGGQSMFALMPEAFAAVREAAKRAIGQRHRDQQVLAGAALHMGTVVELRAGEGKTLAITLPAYLNALGGWGVHVLTATDYLAERDRDQTEPVYEFLGLRAGLAGPGQELSGLRLAYAAEITYGGYSQSSYDYLRDNIAWTLGDCLQRGHRFAIVDEADLVMIDRAFEPLQVSGPAGGPERQLAGLVRECARLAEGMQRDVHYQVDEAKRLVAVTAAGMTRAGDWLGAGDLNGPDNTVIPRLMRNALMAREFYRKDWNYIVRDGEVLAVDQVTGEAGRYRHEDGIRQALEAKEGLPLRGEKQVLATATTRSYLDLYDRVSGITGIAATDADIYRQVYELDVVAVPAAWRSRRIDHPDALSATAAAKLGALADEAAARHRTGQPVLVATASVEQSGQVSGLLSERGVRHTLLGTANYDHEPSVIAGCGRAGEVTVAPADAGRGIDSALGDGTQAGRDAVAGLGGLLVLSAQRHWTGRADRRIQDRAGRRGDPGEAKFFISYEDDTVLGLLGRDQVRHLRTRGGEGRRARTVTKLLARHQQRAADRYKSRLVQILQSDQLLSQQRETIYAARRAVLHSGDVREQVQDLISTVIEGHAAAAATGRLGIEKLWAEFRKIFPVTLTADALAAERGCEVSALPPGFIAARVGADALAAYDRREAEFSGPVMREVELRVTLSVTDSAWREHLRETRELRNALEDTYDGEALAEYRQELSRRFTAMLETIRRETVRDLFHVRAETVASAGIPGSQAAASHAQQAFTSHAQRAIQQAQQEAGMLGSGQVGTGHLLLGICHEGSGAAPRALTSLGISLETVRRRVQEDTGQDQHADGDQQQPSGDIPWTTSAAAVLRLAHNEARRHGQDRTGAEHILLALVRQRECTAARVLAELGADPDRVRRQVLRLLYGHRH